MNHTTPNTAAGRWVASFDWLPASLIGKLTSHDEAVSYYDSQTFRLVASPWSACMGCGRAYEGNLTLEELRGQADTVRAVPCEHCDDSSEGVWERGRPIHGFPCAWSTLYAPRSGEDHRWIESHLPEIAALGFYVFDSEDIGYLLGIDGAGYDFFETLWNPLWELRCS